MSRDDDLNVPDLGPAEPDNTSTHSMHKSQASSHHSDEFRGKQSPQSNSSQAQDTGKASGNSLIQSFVIIVLIVAVCGLGYVSFDMYKAQQTGVSTTQEAKAQIARLEELLKKTEQGAAESGEKLQGDVSSLETELKNKDKQLDSEIAKLWVVAHQTNQPKIAEQEKALKAQAILIDQQAELLKAQTTKLEAQAKLINAQKNQLASLTKNTESQSKAINALQTTLAQQEKQLQSLISNNDSQTLAANLQAKLNTEITKLTKLVNQVEATTQTNVAVIQEQIDTQVASLRKSNERITKLEAKSTANIERKVSQNSQAIQAFESTRRQLSQDMLSVKQKLNNLQLLIERK